jgi:hypothetical protein
MAKKRRTTAKPRTGKKNRQTKAKQKARAVSSPTKQPRAVSSRHRKSSRKEPDLQERTFQVFAEQADPLWTGLTHQCREFADGFNKALGAQELHVEAAPTTLRVAYPKGDAELFFQLDRAERYLQVRLNTECIDGSCLSDQPSVGLTVNGNQLQFVLAGDIVSEERLAVTLLTQLTSGKSDHK